MPYVKKTEITKSCHSIMEHYDKMTMQLFQDKSPDLWSEEEKLLYDILNCFEITVIDTIKKLGYSSKQKK